VSKLQYFYGNDQKPTRIMELIESQISELFLKFPPQEVVLTLAPKQCIDL